jgi:hypothetical protein
MTTKKQPHPQHAEVELFLKELQERKIGVKGVDYLDGEFVHCETYKRALEEILSVDECKLVVETMQRTCGIHIVLGNDPEDLVVSYTADIQLDSAVSTYTGAVHTWKKTA